MKKGKRSRSSSKRQFTHRHAVSNHGRARITQRTPAAQEDRMEMLSLLDIFTHEQRILRLIYETLHMVKSRSYVCRNK